MVVGLPRSFEVKGTMVKMHSEQYVRIGRDYKRLWGCHLPVITLDNTREVLNLANHSGKRPSHESATGETHITSPVDPRRQQIPGTLETQRPVDGATAATAVFIRVEKSFTASTAANGESASAINRTIAEPTMIPSATPRSVST